MYRSPNRASAMFRFFQRAALVGAALGLIFLAASPVQAEPPNPDDPLPPGAKSDIRALAATVLPLKATVLEIRGAGGAIKARGGDVRRATQDPCAAVNGREVNVNLAVV